MIDFECAKSWWDLLYVNDVLFRPIMSNEGTLTPSQPSAVSLVYKAGCACVLWECVSVCVWNLCIVRVLYLCSDFWCVQHLRQRDYNVSPITFKVVRNTFFLQIIFSSHMWKENSPLIMSVIKILTQINFSGPEFLFNTF